MTNNTKKVMVNNRRKMHLPALVWLWQLSLKTGFFFLVLAIILTQLWFSPGLPYGGVESGVITFKPTEHLRQIVWTWWEAMGPGISFPNTMASIPFYVLVAGLEQLGWSPMVIQQLLFIVILWLQGWGLYLLFRKFFPNLSPIWGLWAGIFYLFHPFLMSYVWHRFIYNNFILAAMLPWLWWSYLEFIQRRRWRYFYLFLLVSLLGNYAYSAVAPMIAVWLVVGMSWLTLVVSNRRNGAEIMSITIRTVVLGLSWGWLNWWWLNPILNNQTAFEGYSQNASVDTLVALSPKSTLKDVLPGINPYPLYETRDWGLIYSYWWFKVMVWSGFGLMMLGLVEFVKGSSRKARRYPNFGWVIILVWIVAVLLAKGAAEPLGQVNYLLYERFYFLGAIRNPFEKLGLLIAIPAAILMAVGWWWIWHRQQRWLKVGLSVLVILPFIYVWPMYSFKLFGSPSRPLFFNPPAEYQQVSSVLEQQLKESPGKVLQLPTLGEDSSTYNWSSRYDGVDLSNILFPGDSIAHKIYFAPADDTVTVLSALWHNRRFDQAHQLLQDLGIKYLVLDFHKGWTERLADNPENLAPILAADPQLELIYQTDRIQLYRYRQPVSQLSLSNQVIKVEAQNHQFNRFRDDIWLSRSKGESYLYQDLAGISPNMDIFSPSVIKTRLIGDRTIRDQISPTLHAHYSPDVWWYPAILLKEKIEVAALPSSQRTLNELLLLTKRMAELEMLVNNQSVDQLDEAINRYDLYLSQISPRLIEEENKSAADKLDQWRLILANQKRRLEELSGRLDPQYRNKLVGVIEKVSDLESQLGFKPYFPISYQPDQDLTLYRFELEGDWQGEMILAADDPEIFDLKSGRQYWVDGQIKEITLNPTDQPGWWSLGQYNFGRGLHEIALLSSESPNLIPEDQRQFEIIADNQPAVLNLPLLNDYDQQKGYQLKFDYRVIRGSSPTVELRQPSDGKVAKVSWDLLHDDYNFDWWHFSSTFGVDNLTDRNLDRSTNKLSLRFVLPLWNSCLIHRQKDPQVCSDPEVSRFYDLPSQFRVQDLVLREKFTGNIYLRRLFPNNASNSGTLTGSRQSPVSYQGSVEVSEPTLLILKQSFHPGWKLYLSDGSNSWSVDENQHHLVNGFSNGWVIDRPGKYQFEIKFIPQDQFYQGVAVSVVGGLVVIVIGIGWWLKKRGSDGS